MGQISISIQEWQTATPDTDRGLAGVALSNDGVRQLANKLASQGHLEVIELARGLEIRATSFVGRLQLGDLLLTVKPKVTGMPLLRLLRYAYGLRHLDLFGLTAHTTSALGFHELVALQLVAEVDELMRRGLLRDYVRHADDLPAPRGRIDFQRYVHINSASRSMLPCILYQRDEETALNQTLLGGVELAATMLNEPELRGHARRLSKQLRETVSPRRLDRSLLTEARRRVDRRAKHYESALKLVELLLNVEGVSLDAHTGDQVPLRGFLFDMNRFFQALVSRFLRDNLSDAELHDERSIEEMFAYEVNPQRRRTPRLRPDFTVTRGHHVVAVLDAKYRDLWDRSLPREMLYQLALYALARDDGERKAVILYPTLNEAASEQTITIRQFDLSGPLPRVTLRPIDLLKLDRLVSANSLPNKVVDENCSWAKSLVFGPEARVVGK